jgi:acetolactate synthase-1/2/3 large subunit
MKTCGEVLVEILEAYGVDTVFGIPGVHTVELYRGLPATRLRHITPRHEQGAGFMADGYARVSGRPAACFIITGPGMTNIATAMGQAFADSVPMLVISSVNATHELGLGEGRLHELPNQSDLVAGVTVFSHTVLRPDELPGVMARAFAVFNSARPGPVHIELPLDVITASGDHLSRRAHPTRSRPAPDPKAIAEAARLLSQARSPIVVLGGGTQDASAEARRLVDRLGALTAVTINAKGVLPPHHPLSVGSTLPQKPVLDLLQDADVVLAVGTELSETDTLLFYSQLKIKGKLIRIDIEPEQLTRNVLPEVGICSDAALAMAALADALEGFANDGSSTRARVKEMRGELDRLLPGPYRIHKKLMAAIDRALPGAVIVGDSTQPIYGANLFYEPPKPRSYFNSSTGYGTLGYALSAALGAKLGAPERPVVSIIGDGGILFSIGELATATELALPVPILLWNNRGYREIKRYMADRKIPEIGVDIFTPDFQTIARGFRCLAERAKSFTHLEELLAVAHRASGPTLIEIDENVAQEW